MATGAATLMPTSPGQDSPVGLPTQTTVVKSGVHAAVQASRRP